VERINKMNVVFDWFTNNTPLTRQRRAAMHDSSLPGDMVQSDLDDEETPDRDELIQQKFDREFDKDR